MVTDSALTFNGCRVEPGPVLCARVTATETTFVFVSPFDMTFSADVESFFRDCDFGVVEGEFNPEMVPSGPVWFDGVSAKNFQTGGWLFSAGGTLTAPQDLEPNNNFGDGSDGALAAGFGTISMVRDMYFSSVVFGGVADTIQTNGYKLHVEHVLDLRGALASGINVAFNSNVVGIDAVAQTAGATGTIQATGALPASQPGTAGGKGGNATAAGANGSALNSGARGNIGGYGAAGGKGGTATGAGGAGGVYTQPAIDFRYAPKFPADISPPFPFTTGVRSSDGGTGGGGGGGGATGVGGGGGAGSVPSSAGQIFARCIIRDATTDVAAIDGRGTRGGNGGNGTTDGSGGGGAAGAGGAGLCIVCDWLIGDPTICIVLDGGIGGTGGDGAGGADGGTGGTGGTSGTLLFGNLIASDWTYTTRVAGSAGSGPTGSTGGAGGAGGVLSITL